jgi:DNA-binding beta-propeller fold protein YncE
VDGQRKALIIAVDQYDDPGLGQLAAPAVDATALAGVLGDPDVGGFEVRVIQNEPAHVIQEEVEELFDDSRRDDVLLLHFSCHGLKSESGELYFAARNTRPNRLATAVPADFIQRCMRSSRSRSIVLLLDCCYGGAFSKGVRVRSAPQVDVLDNFPIDALPGGRGRAVITASSSMEYAFEGDTLTDEHQAEPSVFTAALVEGLATGDADVNEDGWISLDDLYEYVFDKVRERNPHQTPTRDIEMQGELYLARSRRRHVKEAPIPVDLHRALTNPDMFSRIDAIGRLRPLLLGDNLPEALGARAALAATARTDVPYVATIASDVLREAAIQPDPTTMDFGRVLHHSRVPAHTIHLLGSPVARYCHAATAASWIRIEERPQGFSVTVDTSTVGSRRDVIRLDGPTGEASVTVSVDVMAQSAERVLLEPSAEPAPVRRLPGPSTDSPASEPAPPRRPWRRRRGAWIAAAVALLAVGTGGWIVVSRVTSGPSGTPHLRRIPVGPDPRAIVVSENGQRVYVANCDCEGGKSNNYQLTSSVSVVDLMNNQVADIPVQYAANGLSLVDHDRYLYVTSNKGNPTTVIDTANTSQRRELSSIPGPGLTAVGGSVYAVDQQSGSVAALAIGTASTDLSHQSYGNINARASNSDPNAAWGIAAGRKLLYVASPIAGAIYTAPQQAPSSDLPPVWTKSFPIDRARPYQVAVSSNGYLYVTASDANLYVIKVATREIRAIPLPVDEAKQLYLNATGTDVFVGAGGKVYEIDTGTNAIVRTVAIGRGTDALAVSRDGRYLYVANAANNSLTIVDLTTVARSTSSASTASTATALGLARPPANVALNRPVDPSLPSVDGCVQDGLPGGGWAISDLTDGRRTSTPDDKGYSSSQPLGNRNAVECVAVDLGFDGPIRSVTLYPRTAVPGENPSVTGANFPDSFDIDTSEDGSVWTTAAKFTAQNADNGGSRTYPLPDGAPGRYVRLHTTLLGRGDPDADQGRSRLQLAELEVYRA